MTCNKFSLYLVALVIVGSLLGCTNVPIASPTETTIPLTATYTLAPQTSTPSLTQTPIPTFTPTVAPTATPRSEPISDLNAKKLTDLAVIQIGDRYVPLQMVFSQDGSHLVIASRNLDKPEVFLQVWDAGTNELVNRISIPADYYPFKISSNGLHVISYNSNIRKLIIQDAINGKIESEQSLADSPTFSPDISRLATYSATNQGKIVKILDLRQGVNKELVIDFPFSFVHKLTFNQDSSLLAVKSFDDLFIYDAATGQQINQFPDSGDNVFAFGPDNSHYVSGGYSYSSVGTLSKYIDQFSLWDIKTGEKSMEWNGGVSSNNVGSQGIIFSPDGQQIAIAYRYGSNRSFADKIYFVDLATGKLKRTFNGVKVSKPNAMAFSKDGRFFAASRADGTVQLWDIEKGTELASMKGHAPDAESIMFNPDGTLLASIGSDQTVRVWGLPIANMEIARYGINFSGNVILDFKESIPPNWLSKVAPARYQIDFVSSTALLKSCAYEGGYALNYKQDNTTVKIIDLETNSIVANHKFNGKYKSIVCPESHTFLNTNRTQELYITTLDASEFKVWLESTMAPLGFTP